MTIVTIAENDRKERFIASAGQTVFPYDFPIYAAADLQVRRERAGAITLLTLGTDYSVTGVENQTGGNVVLTTGANAGDIIVILSAMSTARATQFVNGGDLAAAALEAELNRIRILFQQNNRDGRNALLFPPTDPAMQDLPPIALRANRFLAFDANGQPIAATPIAGTVLDAVSRLGDNMTGPLGFFPGTATAPGLRPTNDGSSGIFGGPNFIGVTINGQEVERFIPGGLRYLPNDPGAVARSFQNKLRDIVSVKDFGAKGDGITDDSAAFQAAVLASETIEIPSGTYILSQRISVANRALTVKGAGTNATVLKWTGALAGGFLVTNSTVNQNTYQFSDMTLLTTRSGGGTAISIDVANNKPEPSIRMSNLSIRGDNKLLNWWTIGIFANNAAVGFYENIYISGQEGVANAGTKGIYLGQDPGEGAMCHFLNQIDIKFCDYGFHVEMGGNLGIEGVVMTASLIVQCNRCAWVDASTSTYVPPYFLFSGCQFDAVANEALGMIKCAQIFLTDCVFYGYDTSAFPLLKLQQCTDFWINNCYFPDNNSPRTRTGIYCHNGTTRGYINACTFQDLNEGIVLDATTSNIRIMPYVTFDNVATPYINGGANNITPDNFIVNLFGSNRVEILGKDGAIEIVRSDGTAFIDLKSAIGEDADVRLQQVSNGLRVLVGGNGALVTGLDVRSNGSVAMPGLPTSATGLPSGALWRDPADGNRIKGVP